MKRIAWFVASLLSACAMPQSSRDSAPADAPVESRAPHVPPTVLPSAETRLVGITRDGDVALVDAARFTTLSTVALGASSVGTRDLTVDPGGAQLFAFVGDEDGQSGEIVRVPLSTAGLGAVEHVTYFDGDARIVRGTDATLLFGRGYANQWKLMRDDGVPTASALAQPPASVTERGGGLDVLAWTSDTAVGLYRVELAPSVWPPGAPVELPTTSPSAQLVSSPAGCGCGAQGPWLATLEAGDLQLRAIDGGEPISLGVHAAGAELEAGVAVSCPGTLALLLSGTNVLVSVRLSADGTVEQVGELAIPGDVPPRGPWFSRALIALDTRTVAIATDAGVFAVDVDGAAPTLDLGRSAPDLRAPIVAVAAVGAPGP